MINDLLKTLIKIGFFGVLWVFILSFNIEGRSLYSYAHEVIIQNSLVEYLDGELETIWQKTSETARITYQSLTKGKG